MVYSKPPFPLLKAFNRITPVSLFSHFNCHNTVSRKWRKKCYQKHSNTLWGAAYAVSLDIKLLHPLKYPLDGKVPTKCIK